MVLTLTLTAPGLMIRSLQGAPGRMGPQGTLGVAGYEVRWSTRCTHSEGIRLQTSLPDPEIHRGNEINLVKKLGLNLLEWNADQKNAGSSL